MAGLARRPNGRVEIRETVSTPRGPRSRTLASFRGTLTRDVLTRAQARAQRPFVAAALLERAKELGIPVSERPSSVEAYRLLAALRQGAPIDPRLVTLLRETLAERPATPVPAELEDVAEWVGAGERERGQALRGLLRTYGRVVQSREPPREREARRFPRFRSSGS